MANVVDLTDFVNDVLFPRYAVATNVWDALRLRLKAMKTQRPAPAAEFFHATAKAAETEKRVRALEQQLHSIFTRTEKDYEYALRVNPETNQEFQLWLAERRICADAPNIDSLLTQFETEQNILST